MKKLAEAIMIAINEYQYDSIEDSEELVDICAQICNDIGMEVVDAGMLLLILRSATYKELLEAWAKRRLES